MAMLQEDLTKNLLEFIDDMEVNELDISDTEEMRINNPEQANYYIRKAKEVQEEKDNIIKTSKEQIDKYIKKVKVWEEEMLSGLNNEEQYYNTILKSYALEQLEGSSKKSLKLLEGTISLRKSQPSYEYDDETAIEHIEKNNLPYVRNNATLQFYNSDDLYKVDNDELYIGNQKIGTVKLKKSLDKAALKKSAEIKGGRAYIGDVPIEGVTVEQVEDKFIIK